MGQTNGLKTKPVAVSGKQILSNRLNILFYRKITFDDRDLKEMILNLWHIFYLKMIITSIKHFKQNHEQNYSSDVLDDINYIKLYPITWSAFRYLTLSLQFVAAGFLRAVKPPPTHKHWLAMQNINWRMRFRALISLTGPILFCILPHIKYHKQRAVLSCNLLTRCALSSFPAANKKLIDYRVSAVFQEICNLSGAK